MHVDEIRKVVRARPFKAFEIRVENGEKYLIPHPENIFITNQVVVTVDEQGQSILIAPEAVSKICLVDEHT
ncbi:MAG: hypothetical protein ACE5NG_09855 [bacterium]